LPFLPVAVFSVALFTVAVITVADFTVAVFTVYQSLEICIILPTLYAAITSDAVVQWLLIDSFHFSCNKTLQTCRTYVTVRVKSR